MASSKYSNEAGFGVHSRSLGRTTVNLLVTCRQMLVVVRLPELTRLSQLDAKMRYFLGRIGRRGA